MAKVVVVGGGVIGLSIAYRLAVDGWHVEVYEAGRLGGGSSWAGAGILPAASLSHVDDPYERLRGYSHQLYRRWSAELRELTGVDNEFRQCGGWYLARSRAERATLTGQKILWEEQGIQCQHCHYDDLVQAEPSLTQIQPGEIATEGWLVEEDCQVRNPRHIQALVSACQKLGVVLHEHTEVVDVGWDADQKVIGVRISDRLVAADHYCFTAGAWTHAFLEKFNLSNGILPVRGQMLLYRLEQPICNSVINEGHRYLVPRLDGHLLVGSCEEEVGFACETTAEQLEALAMWAKSILGESLPEQAVKAWAGLRPGVFDGMPYIGPLTRHPNIWFAAGHFRSGLHLSCGTAEAIADCMKGNAPKVDLNPFRPDRYWQPN